MTLSTFLKNSRKTTSFILACILLLGTHTTPVHVYAKSSDNKYYMGETQKKDDAGYGKDINIDSKDDHYGWDLGQFCISGYTRQTTDDGNVVFLKNVGDTASLSFLLQQDLDSLDDNDELHISEDTNGYDEYFGITKDQRSNFGCGTLLVKKTDYQNKVTYLQPYTDYLKGIEKGASTDIRFFEEGDYEVALDYETQDNNFHFWGWRPFDGYTHYQILIKFSVRNGNCMVYPFEIGTKAELVNTSFTENGFYIDLANSRYLTIDVKKQNYIESEVSLVEDTRFYKPASDGEEFTDEGVYIITVRNKYTNAETEKKIYVGADPVLKAYVTTGQDIGYIKELLAQGAVIEDDGTITLVSQEVIKSTEEVEKVPEITTQEFEETNAYAENAQKILNLSAYKKYIFAGCVILVMLVLILTSRRKYKKKKQKRSDDMEENECQRK